jgi:hypothetical protein
MTEIYNHLLEATLIFTALSMFYHFHAEASQKPPGQSLESLGAHVGHCVHPIYKYNHVGRTASTNGKCQC